MFSTISKNIEEKYSISIESNNFYYNIFSNKISCNFLVFDHYQNIMINIPNILIGLKNNILFSNSDLIVDNLEIKNVDFFIKKYDNDSITNLEFFLEKISNEKSHEIDSIFIENIDLSISKIHLQNEIDTIYLNDLLVNFDSFYFSKNNGLKVDSVLIKKDKSFFISSLNSYKIDEKKISMNVLKSKINLNDFFSKQYNEDDFVNFSALISSRERYVDFENLNINYKESFLEGNISYDQNMKLFYFEIIKSLFKDNDLLYFSSKNDQFIPKYFLDLGDIAYSGKNAWFGNNLDCDGIIDTNHGSSKFKFNFLLSDSINNSSYKGSIDVLNFDFGTYFKNSNLGIVNFQTLIDGVGFKKNNFSANISLNDGEIIFNNYLYKNISLVGEFSYKLFNGDFKINDRNCKIEYSGLLDFSKQKVILDFSTKVSKINFNKINFITKQPIKQFAGTIFTNLTGTSFDNLTGSLSAKKLSYYKGKKYNLNNFYLNCKNKSKNKLIVFTSDFGSANLSGNFSFSSLKEFSKKTLSSLLKKENIKLSNDYNLELDLNIKKSSFFTDLFLENFSLGDCVLNIKKNKSDNLYLNGILKDLSYYENYFDKIDLDIILKNGNISTFSLISKNFKNQKRNIIVDSLILNSNSISNNINYQLNVQNINNNNIFDALFSGTISKGKENIISFDNSFINFPGFLWELTPNSSLVTSDFKNLIFSNFSLKSQDQLVEISGGISNKLKLYFDFKNVDLEIVNFFRKKDASKLSGLVNGTFWYSPIKKPIGGYFKVKNFSMNEIILGDLIINGQSNEKRKFLALDGYVKPYQNPKTIDINGTVSLDSNKNMNMFLDFYGQDCNLLNPILTSLSDNEGKIYGKANFYGPHDNYFIDGDIIIKNFSFKVPYLNTSYYLKDNYKIGFKKNKILLDTVIFFDKKYNTKGAFSGNVIHSNALKKMYYNLLINSDNIYCLNTKLDDNNVYYGDVFAAGSILINGKPNDVYFNINAESKKGTKFNIPLSSATEILDDNNLELFNSSENILNPQKDLMKKSNKRNDFKMDFNLNLKSNAQVQIIYDEKIGDIIKGKGEGDLKLEIDENGKFNMFGEVLIEEGEYLYTMQNVLNKNFKIEKGGALFWDGEPYDISIDFYAFYELKTSLNLLDSDYNSSTKVPVFCKMHMTKSLLKPSVDFLIEIPSASDVALTKLYQLTDSEEKKLQQFLFLIGANSFLIQESTENYLNSGLTTTGTELLSNQISNWLSQITDDFDVGFKWTPGATDSLTTDEIQLALSMKLLNDKLTINGNASNPSTPQAQDNTDIVGELDIQYELTNNIKLTAFSRTDEYDPISGDEFRYEQGVSIFFEKEFDSFFDIFRKKKKKKKKKKKLRKK